MFNYLSSSIWKLCGVFQVSPYPVVGVLGKRGQKCLPYKIFMRRMLISPTWTSLLCKWLTRIQEGAGNDSMCKGKVPKDFFPSVSNNSCEWIPDQVRRDSSNDYPLFLSPLPLFRVYTIIWSNAGLWSNLQVHQTCVAITSLKRGWVNVLLGIIILLAASLLKEPSCWCTEAAALCLMMRMLLLSFLLVVTSSVHLLRKAFNKHAADC